MAFAAIQAPREADTPVDRLNHAQRGALSGLSPEEVTVLTNVQARLAAASDDVEGQSVSGVGIF
jgi:hypothetical protein